MPTPIPDPDPRPTSPAAAPGENTGEVIASASSDSPAPAQNTVAPSEPSVQTGTSSQASVDPKKKRSGPSKFKPSRKKNTRYAHSIYFPLTACSPPPRGACERVWSRKNPNGTADDFEEYFKNLSDEGIKVRRTTASGNITDTAPQELAEQDTPAAPKVVLELIRPYEHTDTHYRAP